MHGEMIWCFWTYDWATVFTLTAVVNTLLSDGEHLRVRVGITGCRDTAVEH
jgi:hypothetical protein